MKKAAEWIFGIFLFFFLVACSGGGGGSDSYRAPGDGGDSTPDENKVSVDLYVGSPYDTDSVKVSFNGLNWELDMNEREYVEITDFKLSDGVYPLILNVKFSGGGWLVSSEGIDYDGLQVVMAGMYVNDRDKVTEVSLDKNLLIFTSNQAGEEGVLINVVVSGGTAFFQKADPSDNNNGDNQNPPADNNNGDNQNPPGETTETVFDMVFTFNGEADLFQLTMNNLYRVLNVAGKEKVEISDLSLADGVYPIHINSRFYDGSWFVTKEDINHEKLNSIKLNTIHGEVSLDKNLLVWAPNQAGDGGNALVDLVVKGEKIFFQKTRTIDVVIKFNYVDAFTSFFFGVNGYGEYMTVNSGQTLYLTDIPINLGLNRIWLNGKDGEVFWVYNGTMYPQVLRDFVLEVSKDDSSVELDNNQLVVRQGNDGKYYAMIDFFVSDTNENTSFIKVE